MVETLLSMIPRLKLYETLFLKSSRFQAILCLFYQDLINFCLAAVKLRRRKFLNLYLFMLNRLTIRTLTSLSRGLKEEFDRILKKMKMHSDEVKELALAETMSTIASLREGTGSHIQRSNMLEEQMNVHNVRETFQAGAIQFNLPLRDRSFERVEIDERRYKITFSMLTFFKNKWKLVKPVIPDKRVHHIINYC